MNNESFELSLIPIESSDYKKPAKDNNFVSEQKYAAVDKACEAGVYLSQDGNAYVDKTTFPALFDCKKPEANYIYDNSIPDEAKKNIGGKDVVNSSDVLTPLDKRAHEKRDAESAAINKYSRDSLTNIGDSDKAEKIRRQLDTHTSKEITKLKQKRGVKGDEITGEPLEANAAFHHTDSKSIYTDPIKNLDPNEGIIVNKETHDEIHRRKIFDKKQLEAQREDIKSTVLNNKKNRNVNLD
jgi:hypothetical protein